MTKQDYKKLTHVIRFNLWYFPLINAARMNNSVICDNALSHDEFVHLLIYANTQFVNRRK